MNPLARFVVCVGCAFAICMALSTAHDEGWVSIGPFGMQIPNHDVITGQVNTLAIDLRDANTIYVATAEGGVWKTRDGGASWVPLTDTQLVRTQYSLSLKATMSIGAIPGRRRAVATTGVIRTARATCCT